MTARNGAHGYGWVTKSLHWATVVALTTQLTVGYLMEADDGSGRGRGRGRGEGSGHGRGGDDGGGYLDDPETLVKVHVVLGVAILALAGLRLVWREAGGLPPWAEQLTPGQRRLATWTERTLLATLFAIPLSGLGLVLSGDDDVVPLHVAAHVVFFAALAVHVALVLSKRLLPRMTWARPCLDPAARAPAPSGYAARMSTVTPDEPDRADDRRPDDELEHDQDADPATPQGAEADPNAYDPGAEPSSDPDPDPEAPADEPPAR